MHNRLRRIAIAGLAAFVMLLVPAGSAHAQSWNSTIDTGLTSLSWQLAGNQYTWTLTNNSSTAADDYSAFDILVWDLMPYHIQEPVSWSAPEGWKWSGKKMELISSSGSYYTPYALGPGQSMTFTYEVKPTGKYINTSGPANVGPLFGAHVAAVVPYSGTVDGRERWDEYVAKNLGRTWHDRPGMDREIPVIPEPGGLLVLGFGVCSLAVLPVRRRR